MNLFFPDNETYKLFTDSIKSVGETVSIVHEIKQKRKAMTSKETTPISDEMDNTIKLSAKQKREVKKLNAVEANIYHSVLLNFPATTHDCALNVALQGGVRWNFVHK